MSSTIPNDDDLQQENWQMMQSHLENVLRNVSSTTVLDSFLQLLGVNIMLGQDILVHLIIREQINQDKGAEYAALVALVNSEVSDIGGLLTKESIAHFIKSYNRYDNRGTIAMVSLLCHLFNYDVVHEIVILQILHLLMEDVKNGSIDIVIRVMELSGEKLSEVCKTVHNKIYENLRGILQQNTNSTYLSTHSKVALASLFDLRARKYTDNSFSLIDIPLHDNHSHTFMIDVNNIEPTKNLGHFKYSEKFDELNDKYDELKQIIVQKYIKDEPKDDSTVIIEDQTGKSDVEFKKKIYLLLKSSLSGDEAAHKILKQRIPDDEKSNVVEVIFKTSIQETTYSKFYGILAERLLDSHKIWKEAFNKIWERHYKNADEFDPNHLRILGKLWGHIYASDFIGFEGFSVIRMNDEETTPAGRILIKYVFQKLVADIGIDELRDRLNEDFIQPFLLNMFPVDDPENTRYSINYFTAIGLGVLTEGMRNHLLKVDAIKRQEMQREEEEKEKVYQEIRKKRIEAAMKQRKMVDNSYKVRKNNISKNINNNNSRSSRYDRNSNVQAVDRSRTPPRRNRSRTPTRRNE